MTTSRLDLGVIAGVTDRGLRHHRNEDAMALAAADRRADRAVAVVCDGVSTSDRPDEASLAAAEAACACSLTAVGRAPTWLTASPAAVRAAAAAVAGLAGRRGDAPAATFVSAVLTERSGDGVLAG